MVENADILRSEFGGCLTGDGDFSQTLAKVGQNEQAEKKFVENFARELDVPSRIVNANQLIALSLGGGRYYLAAKLADLSVKLSGELGNCIEKALAYLDGARIAYIDNDFSYSLELSHRSLDIFEDLQELALTSSAKISIGNSYKKLGDLEMALEHYKEALALSEECKDDRNIAVALNNIGNIHLSMGHDYEALEYYYKSVYICKANDFKRILASTYNNMGLAYKAQQNIKKSLECFKKASEICLEIDCYEGEIITLINTSQLDSGSGNYQVALEKIDFAVEIIEKSGLKHLKPNALLLQSKLNEIMSNHEEALEQLKEYSLLISKKLYSKKTHYSFEDVKPRKASKPVRLDKISKSDSLEDAYKALTTEILDLRKQQTENLKSFAENKNLVKSLFKVFYASASLKIADKIPQEFYTIYDELSVDCALSFEDVHNDQMSFVLYLFILTRCGDLSIYEFEEKALEALRICQKSKVPKDVVETVLELLDEINDTKINAFRLGFTAKRTNKSLLVYTYRMVSTYLNLDKTSKDSINPHSFDALIPRKYVDAFLLEKNLCLLEKII